MQMTILAIKFGSTGNLERSCPLDTYDLPNSHLHMFHEISIGSIHLCWISVAFRFATTPTISVLFRFATTPTISVCCSITACHFCKAPQIPCFQRPAPPFRRFQRRSMSPATRTERCAVPLVDRDHSWCGFFHCRFGQTCSDFPIRFAMGSFSFKSKWFEMQHVELVTQWLFGKG